MNVKRKGSPEGPSSSSQGASVPATFSRFSSTPRMCILTALTGSHIVSQWFARKRTSYSTMVLPHHHVSANRGAVRAVWRQSFVSVVRTFLPCAFADARWWESEDNQPFVDSSLQHPKHVANVISSLPQAQAAWENYTHCREGIVQFSILYFLLVFGLSCLPPI